MQQSDSPPPFLRLPSRPSVRTAAIGLGIIAVVVYGWVSMAGRSLAFYEAHNIALFLLMQALSLLGLYLFIVLLSGIIRWKWLRLAVGVIVAIPAVSFIGIMPVIVAGVAGKPHAMAAQEGIAPVLSYIDQRVQSAGKAPDDIAPALDRLESPPTEVIYYGAKGEKFSLRVLVARSSYYHPVILETTYASAQGSWNRRVAPKLDVADSEVQFTRVYFYDRQTGKWKGEELKQ